MRIFCSIHKQILFSQHPAWWFISNFYLITALSGFLILVTSHGELIVKLYFVLVSYFAVKNLITKASLLDYLFALFIVLMLSTSFVQNYNYMLLTDGIFGLSNMLFFLIARSNQLQVDDIIKKGIAVYIVVSFIGLVLFLTMPPWYMEWKMRGWGHVWTESHILEMTRLSAFWSYPYWISYGGTIIYTYLIYQMYINKRNDWRSIILLLYIFLIIVLAQQRTPIFWVILITMIYILYNFFKGKIQIALFIIGISGMLYIVTYNFISQDFNERLIYKITVLIEDNSFIQNRTGLRGMLDSFRDKEITLWGDGVGRYGHAALGLSNKVITDQNVWKIVFENGIFGCAGYLFFLIYAVISGIKNFKKNLLFYGIVPLFLIGMFGANCLCNYQQFSAIFWFCIGKLSQNTVQYNTTT